jgi:hypothetical protein
MAWHSPAIYPLLEFRGQHLKSDRAINPKTAGAFGL